MAFKHHQTERTSTLSIWVEIHDGEHVGYGEACPRSYVTGEDLTSVQEFITHWQTVWMKEINTLEDLRRWQRTQQAVIDQNPSAWCAVELALLDLLARRAQHSIEALLDWPQVRGTFKYTAVLGDASEGAFQKQVMQYRHLGFKDYKLKLSGDLTQDQHRAVTLREAGARRWRVDANNLWNDPETALNHLKVLHENFTLFGIEEPLQPARRFEALRQLSKQLHVPIIADESGLTPADLVQMNTGQINTNWILNVRVSKMGGLLRSQRIIDEAGRCGIPLIIGAQVGESSLLTRAALSLAAYCQNRWPDLLLAQEGAFGDYLLQQDILSEPLKFGARGHLIFAPSSMSGWGFQPVVSAKLKSRLI